MFNYSDRLLVVSPHPDDELFIVQTLIKALIYGSRVEVWYCTNGIGGLKKDSDKNLRILEAAAALSVINSIESYSKINHKFLPLPFYQDADRTVTTKDKEIFSEYLQSYKPTHIFLCSDNDPKGTHKKCYDIALNSIHHVYNNLPVIFQYRGAWNPFVKWNPELTIFCNPNYDEIIKNAWNCYESQLNLLVNSDDKRTLYERYLDIVKEHRGEPLQVLQFYNDPNSIELPSENLTLLQSFREE